jgi:NAD(P)-dependent dehydrogenase (short-subunit alcohol dehydrogenase family)
VFGGEVGPTLASRVAVVTGASRGVGREIAFALARANADVVVTARDRGALLAVSRSIHEFTGREPLSVAADVTSQADVERLGRETRARFGAATILVNAAAVFGPLEPFSQTSPHEWIETLMVNTVGPYLTCRLFVPGMVEAGWGRIVNLSSAGSLFEPGALDSAYSTSKAAMNRMTRHLAAELEGTGVTATVVHPGSFKTDMWADIKAKVERLGAEGEVFRAWVERVEHTGGDPIALAADLVLELVDPSSPGRNGEFVWPRGGIDAPVASW